MAEQQQRRGGRRRRRKVCFFCAKPYWSSYSYKDVDLLKTFHFWKRKILPRRVTGTCAKHPAMLTVAIKRARIMGLYHLLFKTNFID